MNISEDELDRRLEIARAAPGVAHMILCGPSPTCELCGGTQAPIIGGRHLSPERFCLSLAMSATTTQTEGSMSSEARGTEGERLHAYNTPSGKVHVGHHANRDPLHVFLYCTGRAQRMAYAVDDAVTCLACIRRACKNGLDISDPVRIGRGVGF